MQKGFAPIVILIGILVIAGIIGGYFFWIKYTCPPGYGRFGDQCHGNGALISPPGSPTYSNIYYSIIPPSGWKVREHNSGTSIDVDLLSSDYAAPTTGAIETVNSGARINIMVITDQSIPSLAQWFNKYFYDPMKQTVLYQPRQAIVDLSAIKSVPALEYENSGADGSVYSILFNVGTKNTIYLFTITAKDNSKQYIPILKQVLSTFKIMDQNQTLDTTNWKTYTDMQQGFTVRYPEKAEIKKESDRSITLILSGPTQKSGAGFYDGIFLSFKYDSLKDKSLQQIAEEGLQQAENTFETYGHVIENTKQTTIAGINGYSYTIANVGIHTFTYLPNKSGGYIVIVNSTFDPTGKGFQKSAGQILSTFKFTQ